MTLRELLRDAHFRRGAADMLAVMPGLGAWGIVTGVAMTQSGLGAGLATLMTLTVFAGSAQLASLPLLASGAPMGVVWASALCVNLRFLIFGLQWRPFLGVLSRPKRVALAYFLADFNLVVFQKAWPSGVAEPGQVRYIAGGAAAAWPVWQATSLVGIWGSALVPLEWGLGFAGTLSMLGIAYSLMVDRTAWIAAAVAAGAAVAAFALPLKLNIVVAIAAAVTAALLIGRADVAVRGLRSGDVAP